MGLLGLLETADTESVVAGGVGHADVTTAEAHVVRIGGVHRVTTRQPIVASITNKGQQTKVVFTQGGQVKVVACVSSGRKDLRWNPSLSFVCCSPISTVVGFVSVESAYLCLLLKPHAAFI